MKKWFYSRFLKIVIVIIKAKTAAIRNITIPTVENPITGMGIPLSVCKINAEPMIKEDTINPRVMRLVIFSKCFENLSNS